jgi:hypothetical protein
MAILPTDIRILFTNYDIIAYSLNLASCSEQKRVTFLPDSMTTESHLSTRLYDKRESPFYQTMTKESHLSTRLYDNRKPPFYQGYFNGFSLAIFG